MKVFLLFLALLLVFTAFFIYEGDFGNYLRLSGYLKHIAEEASLAATLYFDEQIYGQGMYVLSEKEGRKAVEYIVDEAEKNLSGAREGTLSYELVLHDDEKGYPPGESFPSAEVTVTYTCADLFRLPFLRLTEVKRQSKYEVR